MSLMFGRARGGCVPAPECCIAVLGVTGSGKSALVVKFLTKRFISEYDPSLEDIYATEEMIDEKSILVKIMDTADRAGPANCERYLTWANAYMVVYSIVNRQSFEGCKQYLQVVNMHTKGRHPQPPVILVGNKLDMERYRQVNKTEAVALALQHGCMFYEVSACMDFLSVQQIFHKAVREVQSPLHPLCISLEKPVVSLCLVPPLTAFLGEMPTPTTANIVTIKSARAQSKRRVPTITLLKGFKIF